MKGLLKVGVWMLTLLTMMSACGGELPDQGQPDVPELQVSSSAFRDGEAIPVRYTCDGEEFSPPLAWSEPPAGTQSIALICDDPDAPVGTWDHWLLFNIPGAARALPEGVASEATIEGIGAHGANSWGNTGYGGPCPPQGPAHRYLFKLYALDTTLSLQAGATKEALEAAMEGHILAHGQLMGRYGR